ncbi:MAG: hypothetical protein J6P60_04325 [Lachnospiraceae bacterium]|nr:hypothetical protein [Lachnospiraceae bacterium]
MKKTIQNETILFITCVFIVLLADLLIFRWLYPRMGNETQIFTDFIIETLARTGTGKSGELHLFYGLLLFNIVSFSALLFALHTLFGMPCKSQTPKSMTAQPEGLAPMRAPALLLITGIPNLCGFLLYNNISYPLLFLFLLCIAGCLFFKDCIADVVILFLFTYYGITALCTLLCRIGLLTAIDSSRLYLVSMAVGIVLLLPYLFSRHHLAVQLPILLLQLLFPGLFLIYFVDQYLYRGQLMTIRYATGYYVFFLSLCAVSYIALLWHLRDFFRKQASLGKRKTVTYLPLSALICKITPIILFIYHSFNAAPMYAQPDQHHHGEQMIPWQQVFTLGQSLYKDYTPVSGLFPFFSGSIQHGLLGGTVSDYSPAITISMVLFCMVTMYLVTQHVGCVWAVLFAVYFALPSYNRQYFVLPVLLLLFLPRLLHKPDLWMRIWLLSCFIAGLYYPLFGGALVIATLPLLLRQLYVFFTSEEEKKKLKSLRFYVNWLLCLTPVVISVPLLLRMLTHTLTYSSQTLLADGISLWGQQAPEFFMTYLSNAHIRGIFYLLLRFFLPISGVCIFFFLLSLILIKGMKKAGHSAFDNSASPIYVLLAGAFSLLLSYSYTLVRADTNMLLSRTSYILIAIAGMFLPIMLIARGRKHIPDVLVSMIIAGAFSLPLILYHQMYDIKRPDMWIYPDGESAMILDDASKIYCRYEVPALFVRSYDTGLSESLIDTLGEGFMVEDQIHYLSDYSRVIDKCDRIRNDQSSLGLDGQGFYFYLRARACGTGFIQAAKGYEAQRALLRVIDQKRPVVFLLEPESNYYIYYYILTHDYVYSRNDGALYPAELYTQLFEHAPDDYRETCENFDFGLVASCFGKSFSTLRSRLSPVSVNDNARNFIPFSGADCDCMHIVLNTEKASSLSTLSIEFRFTKPVGGSGRKSDTVSCTVNGDTLLIPLGMDCNWLLSTIEDVRITATDTTGAPVALDPSD